MNIERFRKIIEFSETNCNQIASNVRAFNYYVRLSSDMNVLNILQLVRPILKEKGYWIFELPCADEEIGALCYKGDAFGYVVLNTSLPKINVNFALCHEVYHIFFQESEFRSKVEFAKEHYYEDEEEYAANLFSGMLLMPEMNFRFMYDLFAKESLGNRKDTIIRLMNYYQVPYMAVLIRCFELHLPDFDSISEELLEADREFIKKRFVELWLDESMLEATKKDDFLHLRNEVERIGNECIEGAYINKRTLTKVLQNMETLYTGIKGE